MNDFTLSGPEQKAYERLSKQCAGKFSRLRPDVQRACVLHKKQLEMQAQLDAQAAEAQLTKLKMEAVAYIGQVVNARQIEGTLLLTALMRASGIYDQILAARATAPIAGEIILGIATAVLPQLGVLKTVVGRYTKSGPHNTAWHAVQRTAGSSAATSWEALSDEVMKVVQHTETTLAKKAAVGVFAQTLDAASKDLIDAVRNPLKGNKSIDDETAKRLAAFRAKNEILSGIISEIQRTLVAVSKFEPLLYRFVFWYDSPAVLEKTKQLFKNAGLDSAATDNGADYDVISDIILYDMLRLYTKNYFKVKETAKGQKIDSLPTYWPNDDIDGLDEAQRKLIYDKFGTVRWRDPSRPPVRDYKDLLRHWGGTMVPMPGGIRKPGLAGYG